MIRYLELVCPAGTPAALRTAIAAGADTVYCGLRDATNARNYPGLNFDAAELAAGIRFAHDHGRQVLVAINTFPPAGGSAPWHSPPPRCSPRPCGWRCAASFAPPRRSGAISPPCRGRSC